MEKALSKLIERMRLPGDANFIIGGILPLLWPSWQRVRHRVPLVASEAKEVLFVESKQEE
jgi:hypothetical protein